MSKVCKKYVDDCSCVIPLVATSGIIHEQSGFLNEVKVCTFLQRYELCSLPASLVAFVYSDWTRPSCWKSGWIRWIDRHFIFGNTRFESFSPADQELLDRNLMSELYRILDRILRKQVAAKRSKLLTRTILCHCLRSVFNRAGANISRTPSGWF